MRFYAENPGAVQSIREEISRLEAMLSGDNFETRDGITLFFPNNAEERRAKLQRLLDDIEGRQPENMPKVRIRDDEPVEEKLTLEAIEPSVSEPAPAEPDLAAENAELRARAEAAEQRIAELESVTYIDRDERPVEEVVGPLETLKAKIDAVRAGQQELTPDELLQMYRDDPPGAAAKLEDAVRALKGEARRKLSELLNVELAELKNLRGMAGEDREREQQIEYLLGLFTRLGEI